MEGILSNSRATLQNVVRIRYRNIPAPAASGSCSIFQLTTDGYQLKLIKSVVYLFLPFIFTEEMNEICWSVPVWWYAINQHVAYVETQELKRTAVYIIASHSLVSDWDSQTLFLCADI